jgi:hypothetical protein
MATFVPADERRKLTSVKPVNRRHFQLEELYGLLDCTCIELVEAFNGDLIVCDEEAKLTGKPKNRRATEMVPFITVGELKQMLAVNPSMIFVSLDDWRTLPDDAKADYIAGDVIVCKQDEIR